jgi:branched-chain amino acid aminotransferase
LLWYNGGLIEKEDLPQCFSWGREYVYEGLRCYPAKDGPALFRFHDHLARFYRSASASGLCIPFTEEEILEGIRNLFKEKGMSRGYIRLEAISLKDKTQQASLVINAEERASFYQEEAPNKGGVVEKEGIEVMVCHLNKRSFDQHNLVQVKGSKGMSSFSLGQLARGQGYATGLILYEDNLVGESAEANIFWFNGGILYTPPDYAPILLGITRDTVIRLAKDNGITFREDNINAEEIIGVEEIFLTGTATGIVPVVKVGDKEISLGQPGRLTKNIQRLYQECYQGLLPLSHQWLTYL